MLNKIKETIEKYDRINIFGHVRPDGDCIGSQYGLEAIIKENYPNKKVTVVGEDCEYISFLGRPRMDCYTDEDFKGALSIIVDVSSPDRISDQRFKLGDCIIKIDHHIQNPQDEFADISYVEEHSPACCEIIVKFAVETGLNLNERAATCLYTGILTDTGRFRFENVSSHTFLAASTLMDYNVDIVKLDQLLSSESKNVIKFKGYVYNNAVFTDNCVYITMTQELIKSFDISDEDAAAQVSLLGTVKGYPLYFLVIEYPESIRVRLRSRGPRVDKLANKYAGGGHAKASGAMLTSWEQLPDLVNDCEALMKYYLETGKDDLF